MATESIGRKDDGIAWAVYHVLWGGPWWWEMTLPDGRRVESPERYKNERQALNAVEDARRQVLAGLPPVETMASLRARAEAAEARAVDAEAQAAIARGALLLAEADARVLACQWRAVDDTEDLQFFGACWHDAHPGRSDGDLGRDPSMADLVAALRRILATAGGT